MSAYEIILLIMLVNFCFIFLGTLVCMIYSFGKTDGRDEARKRRAEG